MQNIKIWGVQLYLLMNIKKQELKSVVSKYVQERKGNDLLAENYMENQTLKIIFNILTKISYAMFGLGVVNVFARGSFQQYKDYFENKGTKSILFFIIILGILIMVLLRQVKEDNQFSPRAKRAYNFVADLLRLAFYVLLLIFTAPLVFDNFSSQFWEVCTFYIFCIAVVLFIVRKTLKWYYYYGEGRQIMAPWESANFNKSQGLEGMAEFIQFYLQSKGGELTLGKPNNKDTVTIQNKQAEDGQNKQVEKQATNEIKQNVIQAKVGKPMSHNHFNPINPINTANPTNAINPIFPTNSSIPSNIRFSSSPNNFSSFSIPSPNSPVDLTTFSSAVGNTIIKNTRSNSNETQEKQLRK